MIVNQTICENLRDSFCKAITNVFKDTISFFDFLINEEYSSKYDCYLDPSGENYIINRESGEYINWYKLYHVGRCINISISQAHKNLQKQKWFEIFLSEFKNSKESEEVKK